MKDLSTLDFHTIGQRNLNGRDIKNVVKLTVAKAKGLNITLTDDLVTQEIESYSREKTCLGSTF